MQSVVATAERLVLREETRTRSRMLAYERVASGVGRSAAWLRRLLNDGGARVDATIASRFDAMLIRGLEADIARFTAELEVARQSGVHHASRHVAEIEDHLAKVRSLMQGGNGA